MESNYWITSKIQLQNSKKVLLQTSLPTTNTSEEKVRCYQHPKVKLGRCPNQCILFCMMVQASGGWVAC